MTKEQSNDMKSITIGFNHLFKKKGLHSGLGFRRVTGEGVSLLFCGLSVGFAASSSVLLQLA